MSEPMKYVTPDQMRDVVERITHGVKVDPSSVDVGLSLSGSTLTLTKPDGTVESVELPSGGGGGTGITTDDIAALDTYLA